MVTINTTSARTAPRYGTWVPKIFHSAFECVAQKGGNAPYNNLAYHTEAMHKSTIYYNYMLLIHVAIMESNTCIIIL